MIAKPDRGSLGTAATNEYKSSDHFRRHELPVPNGLPAIDHRSLRMERLTKVQAALQRRNIAACLLYNPVNIRYATGTWNMPVWTMHNPFRYALVPAEGKPVVFEYSTTPYISEGLENLAEVRPAVVWYYYGAGPRLSERVEKWADEIVELVSKVSGKNVRLAVDKLDPEGAAALRQRGVEYVNGQEVMEAARLLKGAEELKCVRESIATCEIGIARMREALRPGITENALWSVLVATNIELGGEWAEGRLLSSGPRTFPWYQEATNRRIKAGDLVSFDSDLIGPYGYCADISRTFLCEPGRPTTVQRELYKLAYDQLMTNISLVRPGIGYRAIAENAWKIPEKYNSGRYECVAHGVGMVDESPIIPFIDEWDAAGYDGVVVPGMVLCIESYIGAAGHGGVKLEDQILVNDGGVEVLSTFPFEDAFSV